MPPEVIFADSQLAVETTRSLYPNGKQITTVDHGYDNIVVLVDQTYALRFPRNNGAFLRSQYEKRVLANLVSMQEVTIPRVVGEHDNPPCLITNFVSGNHISIDEIRSWSASSQVEFGTRIGRFAAQVHELLSVDEARTLRKDLKLDEQQEEPWNVYFEKLFALNILTPEQDRVAQQYFREWQQLDTNPDVVLHDDLHSDNMLFEGEQLTGILDFGDTNIGPPEEELRQLYWVNDTTLMAGVTAYEKLSNVHLNVQAIRVWAITHELSTYIKQLSNGKQNSQSFTRASSNLNRWFSTSVWGKGVVSANAITEQ